MDQNEISIILQSGLAILVSIATAAVSFGMRRATRREIAREKILYARDMRFEEYFKKVERLEFLIGNLAGLEGKMSQTLVEVAVLKREMQILGDIRQEIEALSNLKTPLMEINSRFALFEKEMKALWSAHDRNKEDFRDIKGRINFILGKLLLIKKEADAKGWKLGEWPSTKGDI
jgi:hypothetical protein